MDKSETTIHMQSRFNHFLRGYLSQTTTPSSHQQTNKIHILFIMYSTKLRNRPTMYILKKIYRTTYCHYLLPWDLARTCSGAVRQLHSSTQSQSGTHILRPHLSVQAAPHRTVDREANVKFVWRQHSIV